ncbi:glycoside hydrolase family 2 TIM barrel-domain containing protein [uncultured Alistipes sp.]|uniref:glycoside hydrolase family 2 TIM barrel-domain containing protein n=1 Tax=uncultured Alistipes sp. TaxID=538949 RepID=UPI002627EFE6|nr:glycoside hydrolase family 2 TIM barrel-domain containing protein [uncultured Alistipes sp.]
MKKTIAALLLLAATAASAQTPFWQDPAVFNVNGESRRTEIIFHPTRGAALTLPFERSVNYRSLDGEWRFRYFDSPGQLPAGIAATTASEAAAWGTIRVPGNWEVQGHGTPIYVNTVYEFAPVDPQPPQLPEATPVGVYFRTFRVPDAWRGRTVYLNLGGAKSGVYVYVNGREAGYFEDSKNAVRYDITPLLREGDNDLVVKIYRWSTGSWLECQDFWRMSGIERSVYLSSERRPTGFDFEVVSTLDEGLRDGLFELRLAADSACRIDCAYELLDAGGRAVLSGSGTLAGACRFAGRVPDVRPWSAEHPALYTLLLCVDGEYARFNVGFRRFEITDAERPDSADRPCRVLLVNGQPVKFKGVNYHEHNPWTGHYLTRELLLEDLRLMRRANINAIRTSHYPLPRFFYELCDSLGFYVYSEANIESHGLGYDLTRTLGNRRAWYPAHLDRILNMYLRTRNYPCVAILSLGNEAGNGYNFYRAYEELERREQAGMHRPICYERAVREWNTDMIVPQYPSAAWFRRMGEQGADRPVCPSEYAHAMGNSTGSLDLQWEAIYAWPNLQGGFIWDWVDQGLAARNAAGEPFWAYGGDYGDRTPSQGNFLCNGIVSPDRRPHPSLTEVAYVHQPVAITSAAPATGRFTIFNRHYFTDLGGYELRYRVSTHGRTLRRGVLHLDTAPQSGEAFTVALPRLPEGRRCWIDFDLATRDADPLRAAGTVVATEHFALQAPTRAAYAEKGRCEVAENDTLIRIFSPRVELCFDKRQGAVTSCRIRGRELFADGFGFRPNFWRAPTDNDYGNGMPRRAQCWKEASRDFRATARVAAGPAGGTLLEADYALSSGNPCTMACTVYPSGIVAVELRLGGVASDTPTDIPRVGVRMRLPAAAGAFRYFGRGPAENYWDRCAGSRPGEYRSTASAEYFPYVRPQECGHHTDCTELSLGGVTFVADSLFEFNVLRNAVEDFDSEEAVACDYQWLNFTPDEEHDPARARNRLPRQHHIDDISPRDFVEVCLDLRQTGVGGYDSWGSRPEPSRTLWSNDDHTLRFAVVPEEVMSAERARQFRY